ncbi:histidine phosphatase family protein [Siphonobacter sp. SORGH_AS_1065]|uniref:SixA phosphatase family protein n=1 Tax=Siphonobacter sp. SORGH_AS_1065 TaxID=3041795 RepID=UPI00278A2EEE|nr:histidine phosphatase family protein [Siphonobacter sp. SORGH_AS_1065]MDQ1088140.1 phosphohistidine phosphatase [Siphonobacter sp. SORGH_AS_1065]
MTKTLYLVRHAEAEQPAGGAYDFQRSLTAQGLIDSTRMGRVMAEKQIVIQTLISSPAERTRMTAQVFAEQLGFTFEKTQFIQDLYEGAPRYYLAAINQITEDIDSAMLVGHNPSITYLSEYLCHEILGTVPTCSIIAISFENLTWAEVSNRTGKLLFYDSPEKLAGFDY